MNAVIYARYSSDNQREESIEGQLRECKEYAAKQGLKIIDTYIDRAYSAKTDDRPDFRRMIKDSSKRQFEVVLVWKLDRFARSREDSAMNKYILKKNGVKVVSAKESIVDGPAGIILEAMLEGYAEYYSAELAEKTIRGMTENALKGKYNGGTKPLGYMIDSQQQYQIDPLTAPIVKEIFTRYADGETVLSIAQSLNARGLKTTRGNAFGKDSLHRILENKKYIGEYQYRDVVIPDALPAIIDKELYKQVKERVQKNKRAPSRTKAKEEYILTTKLFCGKCGAFMTGESGKSSTGRAYYYYKCAKSKRGKGCKKKAIKKDLIETLVVRAAQQFVFKEKEINQLAEAVVALNQKESTVIPHLETQLKDTEKKIKNMMSVLEQGIITPSTKQHLEELEARKEELEISIAKEKMIRPQITKEHVIFWISRFKDGDINDPKHRRDIVDIFVNSVYVYDDEFLLTLNYKDGAKTVKLSDIERSDLTALGSPADMNPHTRRVLSEDGTRFSVPASPRLDLTALESPQKKYTNVYYFKGGFAITTFV